MTSVTDVGAAVDAFLETNRDELIGLLADLVRIDSQIPPFSDEREIVGFLRARMADAGLDDSTVLAEDPHRPNLIVRVPGRGAGRALVLNGHLDTKPVGDARRLWLSDPLVPEIREGHLYGLG